MHNEILKEMSFDPDTGEMSYEGIRYMLVRPDTIMAIYREVERLIGTDVEEVFFKAGRLGGGRTAAGVETTLSISKERLASFMVSMGVKLGWGRNELVEFDMDGRKIRFRVFNSAFAKAYGSSCNPVCHLTRGVMAAVGEMLWGTTVEALETHCAAQGGEFCELVVKGRE